MFELIGHYNMILLFIVTNISLFLLKKSTEKRIHVILLLQIILATTTIMCLAYSYMISEINIINVKQGTHTSVPLIYKFVALWSSHEGSLLLILLLLVYITYFIYVQNINILTKVLAHWIRIQSGMLSCLLTMIILTSNPFVSEWLCFVNGFELNPALQDLALAIHPPLMYVGYIINSVLYTMCILIYKHENIQKIINFKIKQMTSWAILFFTTSLALGAWWAYQELGWGGFWFWDPVENMALISWIMIISLQHAIQKQGYNIGHLIMFNFIFCLVSLLIVRSGIILSVHAFTSDLYKGLGITWLILVCTLHYLVAYRQKQRINKNEKKIEQEPTKTDIVQLAFYVVIGTIFTGISLPIIISTQMAISIGPSFYGPILTPVLILLLVLVVISKRLQWSKRLVLFVGSAIPFIISIFSWNVLKDNVFLSIALITWIGVTIFILSIINNQNKEGTPARMAHLGICILVIGIFGTMAYGIEFSKLLFPGNEIIADTYTFYLREINYNKTENYCSMYANIAVTNNLSVDVVSIFPEKRYYLIKGIYLTRIEILSSLFTDLYVMIGDGDITNGWYIKIFSRPMIAFVWIGGIMISLYALYRLPQRIINDSTVYYL